MRWKERSRRRFGRASQALPATTSPVPREATAIRRYRSDTSTCPFLAAPLFLPEIRLRRAFRKDRPVVETLFELRIGRVKIRRDPDLPAINPQRPLLLLGHNRDQLRDRNPSPRDGDLLAFFNLLQQPGKLRLRLVNVHFHDISEIS